MNAQLSLDAGLVRADAPQTARDAAAAIAPVVHSQRERVLHLIRINGEFAATDEEMQDILGLNDNSQRPRRVALVTAQLVKDSGRTRKTRSNRDAIVWVAS